MAEIAYPPNEPGANTASKHPLSPYLGMSTFKHEFFNGTRFHDIMNQIPAYTERDKETGKAEVIISPSSAIMRGVVIRIFVKDLWRYEGKALDTQISGGVDSKGKKIYGVFSKAGNVSNKDISKIKDICTRLRKLTKMNSHSDLTEQFNRYQEGKISWEKFLETTGLPAAAFDSGNSFDQLPYNLWRGANGPAAAMAWGLANLPENSRLWSELTNQQVPAENTINGIATRGSVVVGAIEDDAREYLSEEQRTELSTKEGAIDEAFLGGKVSSADEQQRQEDLAQAAKFRTQCLLAANVRDRANHNKTVRSKNNPRYEKTLFLDGAPFKIVNKLTYKEGSESFAKITVPEASSLVPMIKLSKIYYDDEGRPAGEKSIVFNTYTRTEDLLSVDSGGRSGVGIKSFEWSLNGTNIATVKSDITAKLVLYFNNFNDLLKENHEGFKYVDLLVRQDTLAGENQSIAKRESEAVQEIKSSDDQKNYEIKAVVGWAYNNDYIRDYEKNYRLEKALKSQRLNLFLGLEGHEFDLNQDGTFSLTINYRARIDGIFMDKRADVILGEKQKSELGKKKEELDGYLESCQDTKADEAKKEIADIKLKHAFETSQHIFDKLLTDSKILYGKINKEILKKYNYNVFEIPPSEMEFDTSMTDTTSLLARMNQLALQDYGSDLKEVLHQDGIITADVANCFTPPDSTNWTPDVLEAVFNNPSLALGTAVGNLYRNTGLNWGYQDNDGTKEGYEASCYEIGQRLATGNVKGVTDISEIDSGYEKVGLYASPEVDSDFLYIPYFYLGDLIDVVVQKALGQENAGTEKENSAFINPNRVKNMRILLGTMALQPLYIPSGPDEKLRPVLQDPVGQDLINIGDIPIAVEFFRDFWARRVTKQKRTTYPLNDFIKDCLKEFALRALGDECFGGERAQDLLIKDATLSLDSLEGGAEPIRERILEVSPNVDTNKLASCRLNMDKVDRSFNKASLDSKKTQDTYHYKIYYLQNKSAANLTGKPEEDLKNGIIHLTMGEDRGLLKNINFKRTQLSGQRETRVVEQDQFNPLSHLADVYDINATMFGNTIFWPGQYVYINPIGFGTKLGKPSNRMSPSRAMGIGGYHLVTQVSSFIENGKFETTVEARWETSGGEGAQRNTRGESTGVSEGCSTRSPEDNGSTTTTPENTSNIGKNPNGQ